MVEYKWLPANTTPRDGTWVILSIKDSSDPIKGVWCDASERWYGSCDHIECAVEITFRDKQVNGWMPLPPPPDERKAYD